MTLLQATDVKKFYGVFCALDGVSLSIGEGEHVSIIGPNGAGKTTLVNVLTGLIPPSTGTVSFKGHDVGRTGALRLLRLGMARSFQLVNIFPLLTRARNHRGGRDFQSRPRGAHFRKPARKQIGVG